MPNIPQIHKKKIMIVFPKDSEALFNNKSNRTFGGASTALYSIAKDLNTYSYIECISLIPKYTEVCFDDYKKFNLLKSYDEEKNIISRSFQIFNSIRKTEPDIIIQRGLTLFSCLLAKYCKLADIKFIFMFAHDIESSGKYQKNGKKCFLFKSLLKNSNKLITYNNFQKNNIDNVYNNNTSFVLKKGIDFSNVKYNINKKFNCIWIGRCEKWKSPEIFINLARKNLDKKFIMICSSAPDYDYFKKIRKMALATKNIIFLSSVNNKKIYEYLSLSKLFILTSKQEGDWPVAVIEAASSGLPILSYSINHGNLLKNGRGMSFDGNFYKMNNFLNEISNNNTIYKLMSSKIRQYAKNNYNIKNTNIELLNTICIKPT